MKEKRIKIIIGLMTFAVLGLIAVQIYWLGNLIKVEEEKFDRLVFNSLDNVVTKLEKEEAAKIFVRKVYDNERQKQKPDKKLSKAYEKHFNFLISDSSAGLRMVKIVNDDDFKWEFSSDTINDKNGSQIKVYGYTQLGLKKDKLPLNRVIVQHKVDTLIQSKKRLVQNVVTEMMSVKSSQPIEKRITVKILDNQLSKEFLSRGIDGDFYFGVNKLTINNLTLLKSGTDSVKLKKSGYRVPLFPAEFFTGPNELIVYFPGKTRFVLGSVAGMLVLSVSFILLIVVVFYKTVQLFIRQKKITEVKNDLINNITHEFKTPISTISLACEAINEPALSSEKNSIERYSRIIKEENDRLQMMVDTLLNTAALEKDEISLSKEELDLHRLISNSIEKFTETLKKNDGEIILELNAERTKIMGDKFHLNNVFSNLIDNAIKYNDNKPKIIISSHSDSNSIKILISDNGIGIPKQALGKIFETFYRVQFGNIQNVRGNGIGLSYSKKIIELQGGRLDVQSEIGNGSTFIITLPTL